MHQKGRLQLVQRAVGGGKALDRGDVAAIDLRDRRQARADLVPVKQHPYHRERKIVREGLVVEVALPSVEALVEMPGIVRECVRRGLREARNQPVLRRARGEKLLESITAKPGTN